MFNNVLVNYLLRYLPKEQWNNLSTICSWLSLPTISSPVRFDYWKFHLEEFPADNLPSPLLEKFLLFCYPSNLPNRQQQIECDRTLYWTGASTFVTLDSNENIVGCIQVVPRSHENKLPVEYAQVLTSTDCKEPFSIRRYAPFGNITEIYRCRRSFDINKMEAIHVLLMLFKAVWAKTIQLGTAYSCISFDSDKKDLRQLYLRKLDFSDPGCILNFGSDTKKWNILIKDWSKHEHSFASLSKTHFYMQTWGRMSLKKKHLHLPKQKTQQPVKAFVGTPGNVLSTRNVILPNIRKNQIRAARLKSVQAHRNSQDTPLRRKQSDKD